MLYISFCCISALSGAATSMMTHFGHFTSKHMHMMIYSDSHILIIWRLIQKHARLLHSTHEHLFWRSLIWFVHLYFANLKIWRVKKEWNMIHTTSIFFFFFLNLNFSDASFIIVQSDVGFYPTAFALGLYSDKGRIWKKEGLTIGGK